MTDKRLMALVQLSARPTHRPIGQKTARRSHEPSTLEHRGVPLGHAEPVRAWSSSEHLKTVLCNQKSLLELGGPGAVGRDGSPIVGPSLVAAVAAKVEHGLDCEHVACFHDADRLILPVMRNPRRSVEELADAVATVGVDHGTIGLRGLRADAVPHVAVKCAWSDHLGCLAQGVVGRPDQPLRVFVTLADEESLVEVGVVAVVEDANVQIDDVALLDGAAVRDAVADHLIRRDAHRLRESVVVEGARVDLPINARLVHDAVDLVPRHARLHKSRGDVQHLSAHPAHLPHRQESTPLEDRHLLHANALALGSAVRVQGVVWRQNALRHLQPRGDEPGP
mmetsp:Transcript_68639/g.222497  ORF Transcript_68639/g.222497 Transcript_68639/m.222497 type:complete len:337 (+) Transcript_68639:138-1148(+)